MLVKFVDGPHMLHPAWQQLDAWQQLQNSHQIATRKAGVVSGLIP
jgi:hypothetical protein